MTCLNGNGASVRRMLRLFDGASTSQRDAGLSWYLDAHNFAVEQAVVHGLTVERTAAIVAALSPRTEWELNKRKAAAVCGGRQTAGMVLTDGRAWRIRCGESPTDVLGGPKVLSFNDNILRPWESMSVTVDRHCVDALMGWKRSDDVQRKVLDRVGAYESAAGCVRRAAVLRGVMPHQMQAVSWLVWRDMKGAK